MVNMTDLESLPGVGKETANKLRDGGVLSLIAVATKTPGQLKDIAGMSESASRKIINAAREMCKLGFENAKAFEEAEAKYPKIPSGCKPIDNLIGGGLELSNTVEAYGEFSSGKTALSHCFAVSTLKTFPGSYVIWVDSENTFKASRIRDFCKGFGVDPDYALEHIKVAKALSSDHQILLTENVEKEIVINKLDVKLLIIDSLMNHFRAEFLGRGTLAERQQTLNGYLHKISSMATNYNFAVYMTNQVQSDPGMMFGNPTKPIGGHIVGHFATIRLFILKAAQDTRKMKLVDSPNLPPGDAIFKIGTERLEEVD